MAFPALRRQAIALIALAALFAQAIGALTEAAPASLCRLTR